LFLFKISGDFAILELETNVRLAAGIAVACLPKYSSSYPEDKLIMSGYTFRQNFEKNSSFFVDVDLFIKPLSSARTVSVFESEMNHHGCQSSYIENRF